MTLNEETDRCLGMYTSEQLGNTRCSKRDECARYVQRFQGGPMTAKFQWLCPTPEDYYGAFIAQEEKE